MNCSRILGCALAASTIFLSPVISSRAGDWKEKAISPVSNPLFFESPLIDSEIRPIFMQHYIDKSFVTAGGDVRVYAAQVRWAPTERLAIIATKDGYIDFNPKAVLTHKEGFANIGAGLKYALYDSQENQCIITPGLKIELPTGNERVFQGSGDGKWDLFVSGAKGFGDFHVTANGGFVVPNDSDAETFQAHYSLQLDDYVCQWFIPFVAANGFTVLSNGKGPALGVEGFDLINFGTSNASGRTQIAFGAGFRSRLLKNLDFGFAFETGVTDPKGLFDDRYTLDFIFRF